VIFFDFSCLRINEGKMAEKTFEDPHHTEALKNEQSEKKENTVIKVRMERSMSHPRGQLIAVEGLDRAGKSTQASRIAEELFAQLICFPARAGTKTGPIIDEYLSKKIEMNDKAIHLIFSANRFEKVSEIVATMNAGRHVVLDRYAFSGAAYSAAKRGLSLRWCRHTDCCLPKPDLVLFLNVSPAVASQRPNFGDDRYEDLNFQKKVLRKFMKMADYSYWKIIETDCKSEDEVYREVLSAVEEKISRPLYVPAGKLWKHRS
jgi:dTMP kinase